MRKYLYVCLLAACFMLPSMAWADITVNFDDLTLGQTFNAGNGNVAWDYLPCTYGGLTWSCHPNDAHDWEVVGNADYQSVYGNNYDFPSNPNAAYNDSGGSVWVTGPLFQFVGAYFAGWGNAGNNFTASSVTIDGYVGGVNGTLVDTTTVALSATSFVWDAPGWTVDTLVFTPDHTSNFLMDNLTYDPVPEPGTVLLAVFMGGSVFGVTRLRRRLM